MTTHFHWFPLTDKDFTTILLLAEKISSQGLAGLNSFNEFMWHILVTHRSQKTPYR